MEMKVFKLRTRWTMLFNWHKNYIQSIRFNEISFSPKSCQSHGGISSKEFKCIMCISKFININLLEGVTCECNSMIKGRIQHGQSLKLSHGGKQRQGSIVSYVKEIAWTSSIMEIQDKQKVLWRRRAYTCACKPRESGNTFPPNYLCRSIQLSSIPCEIKASRRKKCFQRCGF